VFRYDFHTQIQVYQSSILLSMMQHASAVEAPIFELGAGFLGVFLLSCIFIRTSLIKTTKEGAQWLSGTIAQPAIAPQQAPTLDVNLGPSVQTHRTAGFILKRVGHVHFDHY